jgi:hypothetical protein
LADTFELAVRALHVREKMSRAYKFGASAPAIPIACSIFLVTPIIQYTFNLHSNVSP